jgi:hypothetical protein
LATVTITVTREIAIQLDLPGSIQGLVDQLNLLIAKPAIGPTAVVNKISGGGTYFDLELGRPEP